MAYFQMLPDPHMNYTLNRPFADGEATSRIAEAKTLAPKLKDIETWTTTFLEAAKRSESEKRWADAFKFTFPMRQNQRLNCLDVARERFSKRGEIYKPIFIAVGPACTRG